MTRCDAKEVSLIFPSSRRQRIRRRPQGTKSPWAHLQGGGLAERGGEKGKVTEPLYAQTAGDVYRVEETQLTFPPRKTWYQTEVPPKSMWKSVKQPFTLIRQYLSTEAEEREKKKQNKTIQCLDHRRRTNSFRYA